MFKIETIGYPIAIGLRITSTTAPDAVFLKCRYDPLLMENEFSGIILSNLIADQAIRSFCETKSIYIFEYFMESDRWSECHRWLSYINKDNDFVYISKEITDKTFSANVVSDLGKIGFRTLAADHASEMTLTERVKECRTLSELTSRLSKAGGITVTVY